MPRTSTWAIAREKLCQFLSHAWCWYLQASWHASATSAFCETDVETPKLPFYEFWQIREQENKQNLNSWRVETFVPSKKNCAPAAPTFLDTNSKAFLLTLPLSRTTKLLEVKNFEIGSLSIQYCISKINSIPNLFSWTEASTWLRRQSKRRKRRRKNFR